MHTCNSTFNIAGAGENCGFQPLKLKLNFNAISVGMYSWIRTNDSLSLN